MESIADDEARGGLLDRPGRRKAAGRLGRIGHGPSIPRAAPAVAADRRVADNPACYSVRHEPARSSHPRQ
jgi:hypothetical protein